MRLGEDEKQIILLGMGGEMIIESEGKESSIKTSLREEILANDMMRTFVQRPYIAMLKKEAPRHLLSIALMTYTIT